VRDEIDRPRQHALAADRRREGGSEVAHLLESNNGSAGRGQPADRRSCCEMRAGSAALARKPCAIRGRKSRF
jgi:hypothetical protein